MIRVGGYLQSLDDFRNIPLKVSAGGVPVTIGDVARVQIVPEFRRGIAELNGQGEVAGGVIVVRAGADTRSEEHTSELQSLMRISYAVFCLKKKKYKRISKKN